MSTTQERVMTELQYLLERVCDGAYGPGNDFDLESFFDDLDTARDDLEAKGP